MLLQSSFINLLLRFSLDQMILVYRYFKSKLQCTKSLCVRTQKVLKNWNPFHGVTQVENTQRKGKKTKYNFWKSEKQLPLSNHIVCNTAATCNTPFTSRWGDFDQTSHAKLSEGWRVPSVMFLEQRWKGVRNRKNHRLRRFLFMFLIRDRLPERSPHRPDEEALPSRRGGLTSKEDAFEFAGSLIPSAGCLGSISTVLIFNFESSSVLFWFVNI